MWRTFASICVALALLVCISSAKAEDPKPASLLTQVQAADVLGDLLTYYGDLTNARVDAMQEYLRQIGKLDAYQAANPSPKSVLRLPFDQVFQGVVLFVQQGGDKYADPALAKLDDWKLGQERASLQQYNLTQFAHINRQRNLADSMRAYLESAGQFDKYMIWAQTRLKGGSGAETQPVAQNAQALADRIKQFSATMEEAAWAKAKKKGMTREEFDQQWQKQQQEQQQSVVNRLKGVQALADSLAGPQGAGAGNSAPAGAAAPQPAAAQTPLPGAATFNDGAAGVNDPRWTPNWQSTGDPWDGWADHYPDAMTPNGQGGVYRAYDKRTNDDYDMRVNGEIDRRANTDYDRRANIHIDPKVNY